MVVPACATRALPAAMLSTEAPMSSLISFAAPAERRASMGIAESLIRVSVGIEDEADLLEDFSNALDA